LGQQILYSPLGFDSMRLFTPISAIGVYYILYATMRTITQVGMQYAVKVSYSKDRVLPQILRNCCL